MVDAYSKYPCIHPTSSITAKTTTQFLDEDFAHFGFPHTLVTDNAPTFTSEEFQNWCKERGIIHLSGAPYHPATNGAAERLIQTFKKSLTKSAHPLRRALQDFLLQYRRTPLESGFSPSELLNGRQIRSKLDSLLPCPPCLVREMQDKRNQRTNKESFQIQHKYKIGDFCYALHCGPRQGKQPRWIPAIVNKILGARNIQVRLCSNGSIWKRHVEQLRPRYVTRYSTSSSLGDDAFDTTSTKSPATTSTKSPITTKSPATVSTGNQATSLPMSSPSSATTVPGEILPTDLTRSATQANTSVETGPRRSERLRLKNLRF